MPLNSDLTVALAAFQSEMPPIAKGSRADIRSEKGSYSYRYADLAEITALVLPALGKHGLAWVTSPTLITGANGEVLRFVLQYSLVHSSGGAINGEYPLPDPRSSAQVLGSAITYARRYALCAVTGVAPSEDDDDAAAAQAQHHEREITQRALPPQTASAGKAVLDEVLNPDTTLERLREIWREAKARGLIDKPADRDDEYSRSWGDLLAEQMRRRRQETAEQGEESGTQ